MGFTCFPFSFLISLRTNSGQSSGDYCLMKMAAHILLLDLERKRHFICLWFAMFNSFANVQMYVLCHFTALLFLWNACISKFMFFFFFCLFKIKIKKFRDWTISSCSYWMENKNDVSQNILLCGLRPSVQHNFSRFNFS